jgi:outer membrane murein-binding lipoprotein Lpp
VYGKIRAGLIAAGVPGARIRFIHDAATGAAKAALFADCRAGKVAVLLGSTDKLGVGTNIQTRCVALHHVDAPWRPADVEQREGRALRPGNLNPAVDLYRYVSERSFDSFMWQALERKSRFVGQVLSGRPGGRDVDDIGDATLSYAEVKALATGNPLLLDLAEANAEVTRLRQLAAGHVRATRRLAHSITGWEQQVTAKAKLAADHDHIAATARDHAGQGWRDQGGVAIPEDDIAAHLAHLCDQVMAGEREYASVRWRGLTVGFHVNRQWRHANPVATIYAGGASIANDLRAVWTRKGQHWRIVTELTAVVDGAGSAAQQLRAEIDDLRQRVADAQRRVGEPFAQAADLEAARARRDAIEQAIRDSAEPKPGTEPPGQPGAGAAEEPEQGSVDLDADSPETVRITSVSTWPDDSTADPEADVGQVLVLAPLPLSDEPIAAAAEPAPAHAGADRAALDGSTPGPQGTPALVPSQPMVLPRLAGTAEPLFALTDLPSGPPAAVPGPRARRARRSRGGARRAAALDGDPGLVLFDLPPPESAPGRTTPARPAPARRK